VSFAANNWNYGVCMIDCAFLQKYGRLRIG
jgi:hypothetical protein